MTAFEVVALLAVFAIVALLVHLLDPMTMGAWFREEMRLLREESWADGIYQGPGTGKDPRVAEMAERQAALAKRMRREGRHLLGPERKRKAWEPGPSVLGQPNTDNVVPLRAAGGKR